MTAAFNPEPVPFWPWGLILLIAGLYVLAVAALIAAGRREDARALAGFIPDCIVLVSRLAPDRPTSPPRRPPPPASPAPAASRGPGGPPSSLPWVTSPCRSISSQTSCRE